MRGVTALGRVRRPRWLLVIVGSLLAVALVGVGFPRPAAKAAQGQLWLTGVHWAGVMQTNTTQCSVTVVSEFVAITAKHCGSVNPLLKLNVASAKEQGNFHAVKEIIPNRDLDVEAIILRDRTGLTVTPLREAVQRDWFYVWGYGLDWSNNEQEHLTRADFTLPQLCPEGAPPDKGSLCWQTDAKNSVCRGDSGAPVTQKGAIIGMFTTSGRTNLDDCGTVSFGQAIPVQQMQPWLNEVIAYGNPFD